MKEFVVFYAVAGGALQAKKVEAANVSEAACALVRMVPEAIVMDYPREVLFVPRVVAHNDAQWGNYANSRARAHARFHERQVVEGHA